MDSRFPGWAARHALFAPWGILATTYVLTVYVKAVGWNIWNDRANIVTMSDMADLGLIVYACGASLVEVFIGMAFYALEQRKKRMEQRRREEEERRKEEEQRLEKARQRGREIGRQQVIRMFAIKANENPQASVEELVEAVTSEMEKSERN